MPACRAILAFVLIGTIGAQAPLRWLDLEGDTARQTTVHRDPGQYLGHPTTVLLADGSTMLCVHPEGHGAGPIVLQRSLDGGRHWSEPLPVPASWSTSRETPTIHRLTDPSGKERLVLFSGLHPVRSSVSTDGGATWSELQPIGDFGGIVAMASVVSLANGEIAAFFHDDGRYFTADGAASSFTVYQTRSADGGQSWRAPTVVWTGSDMDLCEPGVVRSPDGKRLVMLLRENSRRSGSQLLCSDDEAVTWSQPRALSASLCGDRHTGAYAPDGRLLVTFRDMAEASPTRGDWVAWVGTFDDLLMGRDGQYRVRLCRNWRGTDCGYAGVEVLRDGTFVLTSYGHWEPGEKPFVRAVRLQLGELADLEAGPTPTFPRPPGTTRPTPRFAAWWHERVASQLEVAQAGGHRLVFLGDSITQGWQGDGKASWNDLWADRHAQNLGISGDRTQNVLWRLDHGLLTALAATANDVRCVVLLIGTNNSNGNECTAEEIALGIEAVVRRLRAGLPRANVLLLSLFPRGEEPGPQRAKCTTASQLAAKALAGDSRVLCRNLDHHFVDARGAISSDLMPDFLHLSAAGYRIWGEAIHADVEALLVR